MDDLSQFHPKALPSQVRLEGSFVDVVTLDWDAHGLGLSKHITGPHTHNLWTYVPIGPFDDLTGFQNVMSYVGSQLKWETCVILSKRTGEALGTASYMRVRPEHGSAEIGCVVFGAALQKTRDATEAMYLMAKHLFEDLGYRRYEWKCHNDNAGSKRAAERLGFQFEGVFRQDMVMKGQNRDTAWFSITDKDWPRVKVGFEGWLSDDNFSDAGDQVSSLVTFRNGGA